ncbi:glycoside hydrolase family 2 TIM barrel-domain containing protein [Nocardiopsis xinjiangensis]|uniref:glycoside hydrolase family 2 TIM barrel-domain containing protein n=1 Tax=Nocardiopsis xinjiangensis TaxID=124285 RepID=UPI000347B95A|nr:glycoside hydrolase family 2 TIM barrel-domain containing protein [Nocardiopsis xinjiangensis]
MGYEDFNRGWSFRPKVTAFQELGGTAGSQWQEVTLPHDALIAAARRPDTPRGETTAYFPGGAFEYRKTFAVPGEDRGKRILLEFDGVYRDAMVYVNGHLAGQHAFGYSRFTVRVDPYLDFGADNEVRVACRAHLDSRWYSGAGIHRDVRLVVKNSLHIAHDGVTVTTPDVDDQRAVVEVAARVANTGAVTTTARVTAVIIDGEGREVATSTSPVTLLPSDEGIVRRRLFVPHPARWSVESPHLYEVRLRLDEDGETVDEEAVTFGIRTLQLDPGRGLRINGEPVKLRGACIHSDNGPLGAAAVGAAEVRRIALLKEAGFNAVRISHNPAGSALLDACDRLGMLVMDETFDMWTSGKSDFDYASDFAQWWERDVEALVAKDFNHPSVVFYSIGNEIPETGTGVGAAWGRRLAEKVRSLDPTRFVTNGINNFVSLLDTVLPEMQRQSQAREEEQEQAAAGGVNTMMAGFGQMMGQIQASEHATRRTEESYAVLDVAGMNYGDARYTLDRQLFPDRVIIGTETWPSQIDANWELVKANDHVLGDFTWTGWDYLGETGVGLVRYEEDSGTSADVAFSAGYPALTAWCGDIDITGRRRPMSFYRETVFGLRTEPYIAVQDPARNGRAVKVATPWAWNDVTDSWTWPGCEGRPVHVEVYSDAEEVELLLDGTVIGRAPVGGTKSHQADFELIYQPGELIAVSYSGGEETGRSRLVTAGDALHLRARAERTRLDADTRDLAFIALELTDADGVVRADVERTVSVTVDGAGVLQALASANPVTEEGFTDGKHLTFGGRALAIVRPTGTGSITVTALCEGCEPTTVALTAR